LEPEEAEEEEEEEEEEEAVVVAVAEEEEEEAPPAPPPAPMPVPALPVENWLLLRRAERAGTRDRPAVAGGGMRKCNVRWAAAAWRRTSCSTALRISAPARNEPASRFTPGGA